MLSDYPDEQSRWRFVNSEDVHYFSLVRVTFESSNWILFQVWGNLARIKHIFDLWRILSVSRVVESRDLSVCWMKELLRKIWNSRLAILQIMAVLLGRALPTSAISSGQFNSLVASSKGLSWVQRLEVCVWGRSAMVQAGHQNERFYDHPYKFEWGDGVF